MKKLKILENLKNFENLRKSVNFWKIWKFKKIGKFLNFLKFLKIWNHLKIFEFLKIFENFQKFSLLWSSTERVAGAGVEGKRQSSKQQHSSSHSVLPKTRMYIYLTPTSPEGWYSVPQNFHVNLILLAIIHPDGNRTTIF